MEHKQNDFEHFVESNPEQFDFDSTDRPDSCGTPGCALGWIGFYADIKPENYECIVDATARALGVSSGHFYSLMDRCADSREWIDSAESCAKGLRVYADKYFPANS